MTSIVMGAAIVLAIAGIAKLRQPIGTRQAIRNIGVGVPTFAIQLLGLYELALGVTIVMWAPPIGIGLLAATYAGFAVFAGIALAKKDSAASCGCFGAAETPVHPAHVAVNVGIALCMAAAIHWRPDDITTAPIMMLVAAATLAGALILALTLLPSLLIATAPFLATDKPQNQ